MFDQRRLQSGRIDDLMINELVVQQQVPPEWGKVVAQTVAGRLGKSLLELGGNNAIIVTPDADIKMTVIGAVFGAIRTAGQHCTSTRRLIIHESVYDKVKNALVLAYSLKMAIHWTKKTLGHYS